MCVAQVPPGVNKVIVQKAPGQARWRPTVQTDGVSRTSVGGLAVLLRLTYWTVTQSPHIHPKVMSERLGHSSITITLDLYSHAIPALGADAADRIAAVVDGF